MSRQEEPRGEARDARGLEGAGLVSREMVDPLLAVLSQLRVTRLATLSIHTRR